MTFASMIPAGGSPPPSDEDFYKSLWNDDSDSAFPTMRWYGDSHACRECRHSDNAHGAEGCIAVVNVYRGGSSFSGSKGTKHHAGLPPSQTPGVLAYSYPCPCKLIGRGHPMITGDGAIGDDARCIGDLIELAPVLSDISHLLPQNDPGGQ